MPENILEQFSDAGDDQAMYAWQPGAARPDLIKKNGKKFYKNLCNSWPFNLQCVSWQAKNPILNMK